ncbi:MAG: stage V sporulation protein AC [Clostridiales bacterium]|jgi:stage V sporulation protein AC|nr:stage V sporulation protein AC [Clostridiales bacterium]
MDSSEQSKLRYQNLVYETAPKSRLFINCLKAFAVGGAICDIGQFISNMYKNLGAGKDTAGAYTSITMIFLGVLLTGIGWYDKLGKHAGAGSAVPITGFANSVAAPAMEYKKEGMILGMAAKMFILAGPVIVYGTLTSIIVGLFYYFWK